MNKAPPLPELYKMYPPFPDMDEKKILVSSSTGSAVGQLVTNWQVSEGLFGVRIEFANPTVYGPAQPDSIFSQRPAVDYLLLSETEIRSIKECDHQSYQYTIDLQRNEASSI
jgi:hypothetical protein